MRSGWFVFLLLLLGVWSADASLLEGIPMTPESGTVIKVSCCFASVTPGGFTPIDVTINNHSGATRRWNFTFLSPGFYMNAGDRLQSDFSLTVENNLTRTFPLLVPAASQTQMGIGRSMPIQVTVTGYGAKGATVQIVGGSGYTGRNAGRFVVISESLGTPIWSSLASRLQRDGMDLEGSTVKPDDLPEDWRGLTGVAALWLTADELTHLSAPQRQAIQTWVRTGGHLTLCGTTSPPPDFHLAGFGRVEISQASTLDIYEVARAVRELKAPVDPGAFPKAPELETVKPNVGLLSGFMACFGAVIGPLNIFLLARRRRERLLWTTPLIAIGASGLLAVIIVLQDGIGGSGIRVGTMQVFPDSHTAVLVQKQISRTGLLLNSKFEIRDPVLMEPEEMNPGRSTATHTLRMTGKVFDQGWFTSRAIQSQRIVTVIPTRAEITVLNPNEAAQDAPPVIVSSFEGTLFNLVYCDDRGGIWAASNVRTGQKQTMERATKGVSAPARGFFRATADQGGEYLATASSLRWKDEPMAYTGPVTIPH